MFDNVYLVTFETGGEIISTCKIKAENKRTACRLAQFHKRNTKEIARHKHVKTIVRMVSYWAIITS
jgi:hypothetical protein